MSKLNNVLICLIGKSGSGKSTIAERMGTEYDYQVLRSYTTRPARKEGDTDHRYVDLQTFEALPNKVAYAEFDGNHYCALSHQIEESDIYVVDVAGLEQLSMNYTGSKKIIPIYLTCPMETCLERMRKRGDSEDKIWDRLRHDDKAFQYASNHSLVEIEATSTVDEIVYDINNWIAMLNIYGLV